MKNIAIFASGSGTNAENIIDFFRTSPNGKVRLVLSNRADAGVLARAQSHDIECFVFDRKQFYDTGEVLGILKQRKIDFIVLAGFLWLVPENILKVFDNKIVNIHPALLPGYGGKGMYGRHVHEAVIQNEEPESGITIHFVNKKYDQGDVIFQARCKVDRNDTADTLASKIHLLEYEHFPGVIDALLQKL